MSAAVLLAVQQSAANDSILNETFNLFALISFEPLPIDVIVAYIQPKNQKCEKEEIYMALKQCSLFLFTENDDDVRLHRVVHEATELFRHRKGNEMKYSFKSEIVHERNRVQHAAKALYCFKDRDDEAKILPHLKLFNLVNNKSFFEEVWLGQNDSVLNNHEIAKIYIFFGQILRSNYQFKLSLEFLNISLQIWRNSDRDISIVFCELGKTHYEMGEYIISKDYHQRELESIIKVLGVNHIDVATTYNNLGLVHEAIGEMQQAKDYYIKALEIGKYALGPNHINVAESYDNLGSVYNAMGELEQAKDYHERAIEITKNALGPGHIRVATYYNNLGLVYERFGELEQAKDYHIKAIEIGKKCTRPETPKLCYILQQLRLGVPSYG